MKPKEENEKQNQRKFLIWITIFFAITLLLIVILSYYLVFLYPENQVSQLGITNITEKANFINQYRTTSIQLISTIAQIFGGIAVLIGIYFAWKNLEVAQYTLESNQKNAEKNIEVALSTLDANIKDTQKSLEIAQEGQITERFSRAVDQLGAVDKDGNPAIEIRLGGIYALERITNESERDYWPIMEILTSYVKNNSRIDSESESICLKIEKKSTNVQLDEITKIEAPKAKKISLEIQVILTLLGRRKYTYKNGEIERINLSYTHLVLANLERAKFRGANFRKANLKEARFEGANLERARFEGANLQGAFLNKYNTNLKEARFQGANLERTHFEGANLQGAILEKANLQGAYLQGACLREVNFSKANLERVNLTEANLERAYLKRTNLQGANLQNAYLEGANLQYSLLNKKHNARATSLIKTNLSNANLSNANLSNANLKWTNLEGANLQGTNLKGTHNLLIDQLSKVKTLYMAELDPELEKALREKYPALFEKPEE